MSKETKAAEAAAKTADRDAAGVRVRPDAGAVFCRLRTIRRRG